MSAYQEKAVKQILLPAEGAFPNKPGERPGADERIARVPMPETDPVLGREGGLLDAWKSESGPREC